MAIDFLQTKNLQNGSKWMGKLNIIKYVFSQTDFDIKSNIWGKPFHFEVPEGMTSAHPTSSSSNPSHLFVH